MVAPHASSGIFGAAPFQIPDAALNRGEPAIARAPDLPLEPALGGHRQMQLLDEAVPGLAFPPQPFVGHVDVDEPLHLVEDLGSSLVRSITEKSMRCPYSAVGPGADADVSSDPAGEPKRPAE